MGVQPQDEFEKSLLSIKSEQAKIEKKEDWQRKVEEARTLAALDNVKKVKSIAWVPETFSKKIKPTFDDNTLMGKYVVKYEEGPEMKDIRVKVIEQKETSQLLHWHVYKNWHMNKLKNKEVHCVKQEILWTLQLRM